MVKLRSIWFVYLIIFLIPACQPFDSQTANLPTLVPFPTETATHTPTETPVASDTPTPTNTPTQTVTPSPTASFTATRTPSPSPTWTRMPSATPTNTLTHTPSPSPTPLVTITPIPTRTPDVPVIDVFQANSTVVANGDPVTLRWAIQATAARLEVVDSSGNILQTLPVDLVGSYSTNTPLTGNVVTYRLTAVRGSQEVRSIVTVDMDSACTIPWFFNNPPSTAGCATVSASTVTVTVQQFQNGFMFQTNPGNGNRVCGVQFDRNFYSCYAAQTYTGTPPVTPPSGFIVPDPIFQQVFYTQLATGGFWYDIIGWPTTGATTSNNFRQIGSNGLTYYQFSTGIYPFDSNLTSVGSATRAILTP